MDPQGISKSNPCSCTGKPEKSHPVLERGVQELLDFCQAWCCDHLPWEIFQGEYFPNMPPKPSLTGLNAMWNLWLSTDFWPSQLIFTLSFYLQVNLCYHFFTVSLIDISPFTFPILLHAIRQEHHIFFPVLYFSLCLVQMENFIAILNDTGNSSAWLTQSLHNRSCTGNLHFSA